MNRNRLLVVTAAVVVLVGLTIASTTLSAAGSTSSNLAVSATVTANCTIATSPVAFGTYDAMGTSEVTATGGVTVNCTKSASATVSLGTGLYASGAVRNMKTGTTGTDSLAYELYQENAHNTIWNTTNLQSYVSSSKSTAKNWPVYGRIAAGQDVSAGTYGDTVVATVNF
jgi:spore coat protein U-like protein